MARSRQDGSRSSVNYDQGLLIIVFLLVGFGILVLYSTSAYIAEIKNNDSMYYVKRQAFSTVLGLFGMTLLSKIDYHIWSRLSVLPYLVALAACVFVVFFGVEINGARRWIRLGPITIQPSEFAKLAVILLLAYMIEQRPYAMKKVSQNIKLFILVLPLLASIAVNNLSTAIIIAAITVAVMFVASPKSWFFIVGGVLALLVLASVLVFVSTGYRAQRIDVWMHPDRYEKGYQTIQGLYAIGSGGLFGRGFGKSIQKLGFLPEAQNDMIFSIICEELGLLGAIFVIVIFLVLVWRLMVITVRAADLYGALIASGIMVHIAVQVILNIAVVTNSMPNTGITLPFVSYGGTSVIFLLSEMGLALNVSRGSLTEREEQSEHDKRKA